MIPDIHDPEYWLEQLSPLLNELQFAFASAVPKAEEFFRVFKNRSRINRPLYSSLVRYEVLEYLTAKGYNAIDEVPTVDGPIEGCGLRHLPNNGIELRFQASCIRIRKGTEPPCPHTGASQDFYQQSLDFGDAAAGIVTNLLVLWDLDDKLQFCGLRLVRPVNGGPKFVEWDWQKTVPIATVSPTDVVTPQYGRDPELPYSDSDRQELTGTDQR